MTGIQAVTIEADDPAAARLSHKAAFDLGDVLRVAESHQPTSGFRGFTLSLVVSQPSTVDALIRSALDAGAGSLKPAKKSFWGYGGAVQAPDGTVWTVATSAKKDSGPPTREVDQVVLLLGVEDVKATKRFYLERGFAAGRSFGGRYAELDAPGAAADLALYPRRAAAKNAGVPPEGSGSHRLVIHADTGPFTDPDGFVWAGRSEG